MSWPLMVRFDCWSVLKVGSVLLQFLQSSMIVSYIALANRAQDISVVQSVVMFLPWTLHGGLLAYTRHRSECENRFTDEGAVAPHEQCERYDRL